MGISESMKGIAENIASSKQERTKTLVGILSDTRTILSKARDTVKDFSKDREKMAEEQAKNLSDFAGTLSKNVESMLTEFKTNRKDMSEEQAKKMADFVKNLSKEVEEIKTSANQKVKEFKEAHVQMSENLKNDLAKNVREIANHTKELRKNARKLVGEYSADMKKAKEAWQNRDTASIKTRKAVSAPKPAVEKASTVKESVEEKVEARETGSDLHGTVLKLISKHHKGISVGDMETKLGVMRARLGQVAKKLLDEGKVRKEENLYFPE
ncbi:MAG: hypothetical protein PHW04_03295 [Candidatus Wallbacteria bacterium]|nr:hypothetical protein [Candidatus Wallbacteria bacterium]